MSADGWTAIPAWVALALSGVNLWLLIRAQRPLVWYLPTKEPELTIWEKNDFAWVNSEKAPHRGEVYLYVSGGDSHLLIEKIYLFPKSEQDIVTYPMPELDLRKVVSRFKKGMCDFYIPRDEIKEIRVGFKRSAWNVFVIKWSAQRPTLFPYSIVLVRKRSYEGLKKGV